MHLRRPKILPKHPLLNIQILPRSPHPLRVPPPEENPLGKLPRLHAREKQTRADKHNPPLPRYPLVFKHSLVDDGDIKQGEEGDEADHDGPEEELVAPDVVHPLRQVELGAGLHAEKRAAHVNHFPRQEQREPRQTRKRRGAGAKDNVARVVVRVVAILTELAAAEAKHDQRKGRQTQRSDPQPVHDHVDEELHCENSRLERLGRAAENVGHGALETQAHVGHARRGHDDPDDFDGRQGEDGELVGILEREADEEGRGLGDVFGQDVEDEFLDIVKDATALFDGCDNGGKVVVGEDDIGRVLGNVGARLTHGDTNVCAAERWRIIDTVTSLDS